MAVDKGEGIVEKVKDFFTQTPEDRAYEDAGGDDRVPEADRTEDPKADANAFAVSEGEAAPYPDYIPEADKVPAEVVGEGVPVDASPAPTVEETVDGDGDDAHIV